MDMAVTVEPSAGDRLSLAGRILRRLAVSSLARLPDAERAGVVVHQVIDAAVHRHFSDRQVGLLARAMAGEDYLISRLMARAPVASAAAIAAEQFIDRPALDHLDPQLLASLAQRLAERPALVEQVLDALADDAVATQAIRQLAAREVVWQAPTELRALLARRLVGIEGFADALMRAMGRPHELPAALLSDIADSADAQAAIGRLLDTGMLARLSSEQVTRAVDALTVHTEFPEAALRALSGHSDFAERALRATPDPAAARLAFDQAVKRTLAAHLAPDEASFAARVLMTDFAEVAGAAAKEIPGAAVQAWSDAFVAAQPRIAEESLARASPDIAFRNESYSQEGEDLVLARVFNGQPTGFYIDVGALHPIRFSNTYLFYKRGWRGLNIDATPGSMEAFRRIRPRDVNVECLVAATPATFRYFMFNEPALNTLDAALAEERTRADGAYQVVGTVDLAARPLADVLSEHVPSGQAIDFLSVDVEGADLDVLRSNDWGRFRPRVVVAELLQTPWEGVERHEIAAFLQGQGYRPLAKQYNSVVFQIDSASQ
ncbi:MAG: FkbM family methyltransferase [Hyphomonadaceae bacterium]|nr:FkbM family methyltransferase [Hyphomonadaceae bacterium]